MNEISAPSDVAPGVLSRARAVIADDERLLRQQLRARLAQVWPQLEVVAEARHGAEAVQEVQRHGADVVFLDIRMPGMDGIEAARSIAQLPVGPDEWLPEIVFVTAYDQHAVQAFEQGAADYLLKPVQQERLLRTALRLSQRLSSRGRSDEVFAPSLQHLLHQLSDTGTPRVYLRMIQASVGTTVHLIPVQEVLFFVSDEKYTRVQTASREAFIRKPIKELVEELDPTVFWQIHRSTVVNVQAIEQVSRDPHGRQRVKLKGHGQLLEVSRSYAGLFKGM